MSSKISATLTAPWVEKKTFNTVKIAKNSLFFSSRLWFISAFLGQIMFAYYTLAFYGGSSIKGDFEAWNRVLPNGYNEGAWVDNLAVGFHMLFAAIITLGGIIQLLPKVRQWAPKLHRINGRIYVITSVITALTGMYMILNKQDGNLIDNLGININALLIFVFAFFTVKRAMQKDIKNHQRWALRLFIAVSGVWFFRVFIMLWMFINNGPVGFDPKTFTGPAIIVLNFAQYLLPLAFVEMYFVVKKSQSLLHKLTYSTVLLIATGAMSFGIFITAMGMWLPRL